MCSSGRSREDAVSPVVGVMLMLVVTIIIAAVVSAFTGGLAKGEDKAPTAVIDVKIKNTGEWRNSNIQFDVKSVSDPIPSANAKIVTSWTSSSGTRGGNTTAKGLNTPNVQYTSGNTRYQAPLGYGPGVLNWKTSSPFPVEQMFGNYTITAGTSMRASPYGYTTYNAGYGVVTPYVYNDDPTYWVTATDTDAMMALLGKNWNDLRAGDIVKVTIIHTPTGKMIYSKDVVVEG
ncbi:MAG: type IV pilin N-terminal domain-containing protein [Methanoregula sp.]|nr:MAG: type IV pilin N-terminal domain-containing protein [Methanoregula sp.]